jgi:anti-sigma regulatory factor (Ser/Thr protein kinase)
MLVYDELASNVAKYAREARHLVVGARREGAAGLLLVVEDDGAPYDPLGRPDPDVTLALADREPGGLGILLVRRLARAVAYRRRRGRNRLEIRFSL